MIRIDLTGRVALVTGGSSGIGSAVTDALASAGAECLVIDRDVYSGSSAKAFFQIDLGNSDQLSACLSQAGRIDIVVNNAGVLGAPSLFETVPAEHLETSWAVNLRAPMLVAREVLPRMRQQGNGVVVNVASIAAFCGSATDPAYASAKAGLLALTKSLARQYGPFGVRVLAVCPGTVRGTKLQERARGHGMTRDEALGLIARLPLRRTVTAEDVAHLIAFLVSPLAGSLTGTAIVIDAGELSATV